MTKPQNDLGVWSARRFARCPRCQELIDAASASCRYCGVPVSAEELEQSAALQVKLVKAKAKANDRSSLGAAIKGLVVVVLLYSLWFLVRFLIGFQK